MTYIEKPVVPKVVNRRTQQQRRKIINMMLKRGTSTRGCKKKRFNLKDKRKVVGVASWTRECKN
jgi:hypothetical protein